MKQRMSNVIAMAFLVLFSGKVCAQSGSAVASKWESFCIANATNHGEELNLTVSNASGMTREVLMKPQHQYLMSFSIDQNASPFKIHVHYDQPDGSDGVGSTAAVAATKRKPSTNACSWLPSYYVVGTSNGGILLKRFR